MVPFFPLSAKQIFRVGKSLLKAGRRREELGVEKWSGPYQQNTLKMTANVFREDIDSCLEAGMNGHVGKPLGLDDVLNVLRKFLPE